MNNTASKDWTGNYRSIYTTLGASSHTDKEREKHDYYATDPKAVEMLLELETFSKHIWEPACGEGHISEVLTEHGYDVLSTDLIDRGYGLGEVDFLKAERIEDGDFDIITNPPYKFAQEFVEKSLELVDEGHKVAMFLKIQFLEGKARRELFKKFPPQTVYVSSSRLKCAINGDFNKSEGSSAVCYCWFIWQKGHTGPTQIKWFN